MSFPGACTYWVWLLLTSTKADPEGPLDRGCWPPLQNSFLGDIQFVRAASCVIFHPKSFRVHHLYSRPCEMFRSKTITGLDFSHHKVAVQYCWEITRQPAQQYWCASHLWVSQPHLICLSLVLFVLSKGPDLSPMSWDSLCLPNTHTQTGSPRGIEAKLSELICILKRRM